MDAQEAQIKKAGDGESNVVIESPRADASGTINEGAGPTAACS